MVLSSLRYSSKDLPKSDSLSPLSAYRGYELQKLWGGVDLGVDGMGFREGRGNRKESAGGKHERQVILQGGFFKSTKRNREGGSKSQEWVAGGMVLTCLPLYGSGCSKR